MRRRVGSPSVWKTSSCIPMYMHHGAYTVKPARPRSRQGCLDIGDEGLEDRIAAEASALGEALAKPRDRLVMRAPATPADGIVLVEDDDELLRTIECDVVAERTREATV